jgi:glycosyltransferase involved in cell wall biosynthesis
MDRTIAMCATHILVDSPSQREFLISQGIVSAQKSRVLGRGSVSGVDASRFRPNAEARRSVRERLGFLDDQVVLLYLGRLNRDKGVLDLAAAFTRVLGAGHDARIMVVGPDEGGIRKRMEDTFGAAAIHARFVPYTERPKTTSRLPMSFACRATARVSASL